MESPPCPRSGYLIHHMENAMTGGDFGDGSTGGDGQGVSPEEFEEINTPSEEPSPEAPEPSTEE